MKRAILGSTLFGLVFTLAAGCGRMNAIVGGDCADGFVDCSGECSDLSSDVMNCGVCGVTCPSGVACVAGVCHGSLDASVDGSVDGSIDGQVTDVFVDAPKTDANLDAGDTGPNDSAVPDSGDACVPPYNTVNQCGTCFTKCVAPNDACVPSGGNFVCAPTCNLPKKLCNLVCIDVQSDPENCGDCNIVCPSNLCVAGICQGKAVGDIVYIGHDYQTFPITPTVNTSIAQAQILANSVFLTSINPVKLLSYERYANAQSVARVKAILQAVQTQTGRTITITSTSTDADIPSNLKTQNYDALLVFDQEAAPAGAMAPLGTSWSTTVKTFATNGGVVITLDGAAGAGEMPQFESATGLLNVTGHTSLPASTAIVVQAPGDAVGNNVISPFGTRNRSVRFTSEANGGFVTYVTIDQATSQPNVVHKIAP